MHMLLVPSNRAPDRLEIEPTEAGNNRVRLIVAALDVTTRAYDFPWGETITASLAIWFRELDNDWRGWTNTKHWSSHEDEIELRATHDKLGTVTLTVCLIDGSPENWTASGHLTLDAGGFAALALQARASS